MGKRAAITTPLQVFHFLKYPFILTITYLFGLTVCCFWRESRFLSPRNGDYKMDSAGFTQM